MCLVTEIKPCLAGVTAILIKEIGSKDYKDPRITVECFSPIGLPTVVGSPVDGSEAVLVGEGGVSPCLHECSHNGHMSTSCGKVQRSAAICVPKGEGEGGLREIREGGR